MTLLLLVLFLLVSYLLTALAVWIVCWALSLIGITLTFSWLLAFVVWVIASVIKTLFC